MRVVVQSNGMRVTEGRDSKFVSHIEILVDREELKIHKRKR